MALHKKANLTTDGTRMTRICKLKIVLLNFFDLCKSVLSVLSVVRVGFLRIPKRLKAPETKVTLAATGGYFYNLYMRKSRVAGLLFLATAALAQHQQSVEITSEPSHHLVFQNEYVRVFDVTVGPHATTLVHKHNYDYLFVTLGDSDVVSVRPGEKPVALKLKDGEVRFTPGKFAHAAINQSDRPFHNITIELLKSSSNVKQFKLAEGVSVVTHGESAALSDQWKAWINFLQPRGRMPPRGPALFVTVADRDVKAQDGTNVVRRTVGDVMWIAPGTSYTVSNGSQPSKFFLLEFNPEPSKP